MINKALTPGISFKKAIIEYQQGETKGSLNIENGKKVSISSTDTGFNIKNESTGKLLEVQDVYCKEIGDGTVLSYTHNSEDHKPMIVGSVLNGGIVKADSSAERNQYFTPPQMVIKQLFGVGKVECSGNSFVEIDQLYSGGKVRVLGEQAEARVSPYSMTKIISKNLGNNTSQIEGYSKHTM